MKLLYEIFFKLPTRLKIFLARRWYELVSYWDKEADMIFMNLGWSSLDSGAHRLQLNDSDESNRYPIQLYHHLVSEINLEGLNVLEIGCGRGGGASFIKRYHKPGFLVGLDITAKAIDFCRSSYAIDNLCFLRGNAESLGFKNNTFNVILNIESSHIYYNMRNFVSCVYRILKAGGYFLLADARFKGEITGLRKILRNSGFEILKEENISANVLKALELDSDRKKALIQQKVPKVFQGLFAEFVGTKDSANSAFTYLRSGRLQYLNFILRK